MSVVQGIMPLSSLNPAQQAEGINKTPNSAFGAGDGAGKAGNDFAKIFNDALQQVDGLQKSADAASMDLATGQAPDMHTAMVALEKADLSLSLAVEVRNKALDAYHEIMRMQI